MMESIDWLEEPVACGTSTYLCHDPNPIGTKSSAHRVFVRS